MAQFGAHARGAHAELTQPAGEAAADDADEAGSSAVSAKPKTATSEDTVDVILKRETATMTMPLSETREPGGLIGRLGLALRKIEAGDAGTTENSGADEDFELDGAADIAVRLRPIIPEK
jgi:hypothetical protein